MPIKGITLEDIEAAQEELTTTAQEDGWSGEVLEDALDYVHNIAHRADPHANINQFGDKFEFIQQVIKKHLGVDVPA